MRTPSSWAWMGCTLGMLCASLAWATPAEPEVKITMDGEDILVEDGYGPITDVQVTSDVTEYHAQADLREWLSTQTVGDFSFDGTTYTVPRLIDETGDGLYAERVVLYVTYTNGEQEEVVHRSHLARHYQVEGGVVSFLEEELFFPFIQEYWTLSRAGQLDPSREEWVLDHLDVAKWAGVTTEEINLGSEYGCTPTWWEALGNEAYSCNSPPSWDRQTLEVYRVDERLIYEGHPVASTALDVAVPKIYDLETDAGAQGILSNDRTWRVPWESPLDPTNIGDTLPTEFWQSWFPYSTLTDEDAAWFHETRMAYLAKDTSLYNHEDRIYAVDEERGLLISLMIRDNFEVGTPFEVEEPGGGYYESDQPDPSKWD